MSSRFRVVRLAALAIALPMVATAALAASASAQEPADESCQLSELVLLGGSSGATATPDTPPVTDVAFPEEACMFLEASFANVFDIGGSLTPIAGGEPGEYTGGCALADVVDDVVTEVPDLAQAIGPVPDVSLSEEACGALKLTYGLLASGSLTPLAASVLNRPVTPPLITSSDIPEEAIPAEETPEPPLPAAPEGEPGEEPAAEEPAAEDPAAESTGEEPVAESAGEEPAPEEPVTEDTGDEPAVEETSTPEAAATPEGSMIEAEGTP